MATAGDGEISRDELFYFLLLLLLAGNETTTNLLSTMFLTLSENPDQFELIRQDPDALIGSAIEEQLRFSSPIQGFYRTAKTAYRVGVATIPAGARVALLWGAANRDPRQFDNPDAFVAARNPSHVAFGSGIHLCLGASLARMESRAVLRELVERVDRIGIFGAPKWTTNSSLRGLARMQVALTPRDAGTHLMRREPRIVIVGAGMSGLCQAILLDRAGFRDVTILEKADRPGGTWRDNRYPGLTCDVPSHLYQYSFDLNPSWSRLFFRPARRSRTTSNNRHAGTTSNE